MSGGKVIRQQGENATERKYDENNRNENRRKGNKEF
jgi:hypothetical protein